MPTEEDLIGASLAEQLRAAMDDSPDMRISQRALSKRLAEELGWDAESARRWIGKVRAGDIEEPEIGTLQALEVALGVASGYFRRPVRSQRRTQLAAIQLLLESIAEKVELLLDGQIRLLEELQTRPGAAGRPARASPKRRRM